MSCERLLLCTDMDRTVIPNGTQKETPKARQWFRDFCADPRICLVYASGRDKYLVEQAITSYELPWPDFAITDVGSMIYQLNSKAWQPVAEWQEKIAVDWRGFSRADLEQALLPVPELRIQEPGKQNDYKLSYYVDLQVSQAQLDEQVQAILAHMGVAANLIWSIDESAGVGLLDILPQRADKYHALQFLYSFSGYTKTELLFAGDSGNDLAVLESDIPAVLVANGHDEVRRMALDSVRQNGLQESLYLATAEGWPGNGHYCAGVLQGVLHFYPYFQETIKRIVA